MILMNFMWQQEKLETDRRIFLVCVWMSERKNGEQGIRQTDGYQNAIVDTHAYKYIEL